MKSYKRNMKSALLAVMLATPLMAMNAHDNHGVPAHIKAAVENEARQSADKERDQYRKPAQLLTFAGVKPGMTVLDVNSGGGYFSEILSYAVGETGKLYAHNGPVYAAFNSPESQEKYKEDRFKNVEVLLPPTENFDLPAASVDMAFMVLAYHDYFYEAKTRKKPENMAEILGSLHNVMKDNGMVIIVDHVAPTGSGREAGNTYHRIDPAVVKMDMEAAGFTLVASSNIHENKEDDHVKSPFDPSIRGRTDRFVYMFQK